MTPFGGRRRRTAARVVAAQIDALLVTRPEDVRYLTGFSGSAGWLLLEPAGGATLITDSRYATRAESETDEGVDLRIHADGLVEATAALLEERGPVARLGYAEDHLSAGTVRRLIEAGIVDPRPCDPVPALRAAKDEIEIEAIRHAVRLAERALDATLDWYESNSEPASESRIAARLEYELRSRGSGRLPFDTIVASGPNSALPHATPGSRVPGPGDLLLIDFGARWDGYCCDLTRTFVVGHAADWQREIHGAAAAALEAACRTVRSGVEAKEVDRAARASLEASGWAEAFSHSTGHGIGLEVHEDPRLSRKSEDVLDAGAVVTVEPGVYLPGRGGVRIEDDVRVTEDGCEVLSRFPRSMRILR